MAFRIYRPKSIMLLMCVYSVAPLMAALFLAWDQNVVTLILALALVGCYLYIFHELAIRRIVISKSGIECRTLFARHHKKWNDIVSIRVGRVWRSDLLWIFFMDDCAHITAREFLKVHCRKAILEEISKFYDGEIVYKDYCED